ncbi:MAG: phosphoesterase [Thermosphaera sp.]
MSKVCRILAAGDWDADGIVATALITYAQEKLGKYPLECQGVVDKTPVDPDRVKYFLSSLSGNYDLVVFLDLPFNDTIRNICRMLREHFGVKKIMYVDHHITSVQRIKEIEAIADTVLVDYRSPTSTLVYRELVNKGISIHQRLKSFVEVVEYMDTGRRVPSNYIKLFELTKMFSKALTVERDENLWVKIIDWLASPAPLPMPLDEKLWEKVKISIEQRDKEISDKAVELAVAAVKIGDLRFIDARNAWKKRGVTALASRVSSILKSPVALLANTNRDYSLLVLKASNGRAYRIAKFLVGEGVALDIAGHPNLAIVRVPRNINKDELIQYLYKGVYYAS